MTICNMPKKRLSKNKGFPEGWRWKNGKIRYRVPEGMEKMWDNKKEFTLGSTVHESYKVWAERMAAPIEYATIGDLFDRYDLEIISALSPSQQYLNRYYFENLRPAFAHMGKDDLKPIDVYQYHDRRKKKKTDENGKVRGGVRIARVEVSVLSDVFSEAIKWGAIEKHPFKGQVEFDTENGRDRYVENWELDEFLSLSPKRKKDSTLTIQSYVGVKIISGMRQQDLLSLTVHQLVDIGDQEQDGIHIHPRKTRKKSGKKLIIEWSPALRKAVNYALSVRPVDISPYVFCTRRGKCYYDDTKKHPASGWKTIFRRYMDRVIEETKMTERFMERDLRAKTATDIKDLTHAQKLLGHTTPKTTQKHYRRKPERVMPAR